ncbi:MAG: tRNA pseudouridine(55) synthase TruB [Christensenellaceae bacterium]
MLGFLNIYKPCDYSSAQAVGLVKKKVKQKCGHMGTLDPKACGVLPIGLNQANRLFQFLLDKKKVYNAVFDFSFSTPSYDLETEKISVNNYVPSADEIVGILPEFIGKINQLPPAYSAKMIDGHRSYKLARRGVEVDLKPKEIEILNIQLKERVSDTAYRFIIECKGGTYIRSVARDFGLKFSQPATMVFLERTSSGVFNKDNSVLVDEFLSCQDWEKYIIRCEDVLNYDKLILTENEYKRLLNGLYDQFDLNDGLYKVYNPNGFIGVGNLLNKKLKMNAYVRDL